MKVKTQDLVDMALDRAVSLVEYDVTVRFFMTVDENSNWDFHPSTNWAQGGPIIERECIEVSCLRITGYTPNAWDARHPKKVSTSGPTPLVAAMRCFVAAHLGDEVELPDEIFEGA